MKLEVIQHHQPLTSQTFHQIHKDIHLILLTNHTRLAKHLPSCQITHLFLQSLVMIHTSLINHPSTTPTTQTQFIHINTMTFSTLPWKSKSSVMKYHKSMIFVISMPCILHNATKGNLHHHPTTIAFLTPSTWIKLQTTLTIALVASFSKNKSFT
jgi:hypothetical protein